MDLQLDMVICRRRLGREHGEPAEGDQWPTLRPYQAQHARPLDRLDPAMHAELAVDVLDVGAGGTHADDQLAGDLGTLQPGRQQAQHLQLALTQRLNEILDFGLRILDLRFGW